MIRADIEQIATWLINSSPLLQAESSWLSADLGHAVPSQANFADLDLHRDQRLGRRFEHLIMALIQTLPDYQLISRNLVISDATRTLGELDAIVFNRRLQEFEHWEITLKFYLGVSSQHWPGPDPRDNLQRKLAHLCTHQFPMDQHPQAQRALSQLGVPRIDQRRLFSRGCLYYPADHSLDAPSGAHPAHPRGVWWHADALPPAWLWQPIPKQQWLCPSYMSNKSINRLASAELLVYVQQARSPVMVHAFSSRSASPIPGFVVSDTWLADARSFNADT